MMVNVLRRFPASPPADTIKESYLRSLASPRPDRVPIPWPFTEVSGVRHPAASSSTAVYYAVNPSLNMFKGFASGCNSNGQVWKTQLSALSSYAPIRVWKINPYIFCPLQDDGTSAASCAAAAAGTIRFVDIPDAFTQIVNGTDGDLSSVFDISQCTRSFAVKVTGIEYLNEDNMAVSVLVASFAEYSPETGQLKEGAVNATTKVYFLSTEHMQLKDTPWLGKVQETRLLSQGELCPAMHRMPNAGSILAEVLASGVFLINPVLDGLISIPALIDIWGKQKACPLATQGHTILRKCGQDLFSLDNFFEALFRANSRFWRAFSMVAERLRYYGGGDTANLLNGMAFFGEASVVPLGLVGLQRQIISTVRLPVTQGANVILNRVLPSWMTPYLAAGMVATSPLRLASYSYKLIVGSISKLIPLFIRVDRDKRDRQAARQILYVLTNQLEENLVSTKHCGRKVGANMLYQVLLVPHQR